MCDLSDAIRNLFNPRISELLQTASESIYAFGKCELYNSYRFHSAGMMGIDGIMAVQQFGRLFRKSYPDWDLTKYDGEKAELWAEAPRSTHGVPDVLEIFAESHKALERLEVTDCDAAGAAIEFGYPVGYCGNTYWGIETDKEGNAVSFEEGAHAMVLTGVKYRDGEASHFWVANTGHGDHVEYNGFCSLIPESYRNCGSWVPAARIGPILRRGDCFAISLDGDFNGHTLLPECVNPSYMI